MVDISVPHMSHIETANTKLSLQVFVDIAEALGVKTDALLNDHTDNANEIKNDIMDTLDTCSTKQLLVIRDLVKTAKTSLDRHLEQE